MKYRTDNIKRALGKYIPTVDEIQIVKKINETYPPHKAVPTAEVKKRLQVIYDWLGIKRTATSTDLNE